MSDNHNQVPSQDNSKEVLNYMVNELKATETPFHKQLKRKAEIIMEYKQIKLNWMRKEDMIESYVSIASDALDFCRNKCVYNDKSEHQEKLCLKNCTGKYFDQMKIVKLNKDYYDSVIGLSNLWFHIEEHLKPMKEIKQLTNANGNI